MAKTTNWSCLEQDLALSECSHEIIVSANIWDNKGDFHEIKSFITTKTKLHNAIHNQKGRWSSEKTIELCEKNCADKLKALAYRANISHAKNLSIRDKNACHLGVVNLTMSSALQAGY